MSGTVCLLTWILVLLTLLKTVLSVLILLSFLDGVCNLCVFFSFFSGRLQELLAWLVLPIIVFVTHCMSLSFLTNKREREYGGLFSYLRPMVEKCLPSVVSIGVW